MLLNVVMKENVVIFISLQIKSIASAQDKEAHAPNGYENRFKDLIVAVYHEDANSFSIISSFQRHQKFLKFIHKSMNDEWCQKP